ncbi:Hypothetical protein D9617_23g005840 [Elsinoe fawcettii]|nr:Hypothetical protein D9617_23g005840 [Elsinoe fawcettii]
MPRTLPWKKDQSGSTPTRPRPPGPGNTSATPKRKRTTACDDEDAINTTGLSTPERRARRRPGKTLSTSPPPAPPDQEPIREGYSADDIYMMVEDEFLSTAQLYTQHLHHAEYQRLKKLAKQRELEEPVRPADLMGQFGLGPSASRKARGERRRYSDDAEVIVGDANLAGLLDSPRRKQQILLRREVVKSETLVHVKREDTQTKRGPTVIKTKTRAMESNTDDEDDLDAPYQEPVSGLPPTNVQKRSPEVNFRGGQGKVKPSIMAEFAKKSIKEEPRHTAHSSDDDDLDAAARLPAIRRRIFADTSQLSSTSDKKRIDAVPMWRARLQKKAAKEKESSNETTYDEIPTFMI